MAWYRGGSMWGEYVPVADKRAKAVAKALALAKKENRKPQPVQPTARKMATTFWGRAWCEHLDQMDTHAARLKRGVTYLRNGSVVDLVIKPKSIEAIVAGSEPYRVEIKLDPLPRKIWAELKEKCSRTITSLLDLLAGKLDEETIKILTDPREGMFPLPKQVKPSCSCPDWTDYCKHVAATFYGVGCLLDAQPELLFTLRNVDQNELIGIKRLAPALENAIASSDSLGATDLGAVFGIEIDTGEPAPLPLKGAKSVPQNAKSVPETTLTDPVQKPSTAKTPSWRGKSRPSSSPQKSGTTVKKVLATAKTKSAPAAAKKAPSKASAAKKPNRAGSPLGRSKGR